MNSKLKSSFVGLFLTLLLFNFNNSVFAQTATVNTVNVDCFGNTTGSATVIATGVIWPITFAWSHNAGLVDSVATLLPVGNYTCTITDFTLFSFKRSITITQPTALSSPIFGSNLTCNGDNSGAATVIPSGGISPYNVLWSTGNAGTVISSLSAGTYSCVISDANSCKLKKNVTLTQPPVLASSIAGVDVLCGGFNTGSASVIPSGGFGAYSYNWFPSGGASATANNLIAATYTCIIADANLCELQKIIVITEPSVLTSSIGGADALCNGGASGYSGVAPMGGVSPYSYSWTPSGGAAISATGLSAGTYTCVISDANNCTLTKTFSVGEPSAISSTISGQNVLCNAGNTGYAGVNPTGGTAPYAYVWSPTGDVTNSALGLIAGTYSCTISDVNNCILTKTITITEPTPLSSGITGTDVLCNGGTNGWANVTPSGATAPYSYSWSPSGGVAATENNLSVGTYTCIVTDINLCEITKTIVINEPVALSALISGTDLSCNGVNDGSATVVVSDGTAPYTYFWNPNGGTNATANNLSAGTYTCEITDAHLCTVAYDITLMEPPALTSSIGSGGDLTCPGATDGVAFVTPSGGTGAYSYFWSPVGGTANLATGLPAGSYTCAVTDANLCEIYPVVVIAEPSAIVITISKTNAACNGGSDGSAKVFVSGGTGPYSYLWSPMSDVTESINNLAAGTYTCNVTDNASCEANQTVTILESGSMSAVVAKVDVLCNGSNNGFASVNPSGGVAPYTYEWSPSGALTNSINNLVAGTYSCVITDVNLCAFTQTVTINEPAILSASISKIDVSCNGSTDGRAGAIPVGGTAPYSYSWTPSGGAAATATNLAVGNYTCTITDINLCSVIQSITISQPSILSASISGTNVLCNGGNTGFAVATPSGGTAPYSYAWTPSGGTASTVSNLSIGTYTCFVSDANNCLTTKTVTISQPAALTATPSQTNILCFGTSTGSAKMATSGGVGAYSYLWSPSGGALATASGLVVGNYSCTISDVNSCSIVRSVTITQSAPITATTSQTNVLCNGANTGSASISASGGSSPYTYLWMPTNSTSSNVSSLLANNYTFTIQDANNCSFSSVVTITQPAAITVAISSVNPTCLVVTGSASVTVTGGTSPYTYNWTPTGGTTVIASALIAGTYTCTVTDNNGCKAGKVVVIADPTVLVTSITSTNIACNGDNKGTANMLVSGGILPYTYSWSVPGGATTPAVVGLVQGGYTCTVTDAASCKATAKVNITKPIPNVDNTTNVTCFGFNNGSISMSVSGGTPPYNYLWTHNGATTTTINSLTAGNYTFVVTDAFLCTVQSTIPIVAPIALTATINKIDASCYGGATGVASVSPQGVPVSSGLFGILWKPTGGTGYEAFGLAAGTYTCIVTDGNGCQISKVATIAQPTAIVVAVSKTEALCNGSASGTASLSTVGGIAPYSYSWYPSGGVASTASALSAGTYTCTVLDANFCLYTQSVTISQPAAITVVTSKTDALCNGSSTGVASIIVSGGVAPYFYSWSPITNFNSSISGLAAGTYTYSVVDANNCVFAKSINISEPTLISASLSQSNVSCDGSSLGFASIASTGGTFPHTYSWSPLGGLSYSTSKTLIVGSYTCTITDANNCYAQKTIVIIQPPLPTVSLTLPKDTFCTNSGTVNIVGLPFGGLYGGSGVVGNRFNVDGLAAGSYTLTYTYNDGVCANTAAVKALIDPCTGIEDLVNENLYIKLYPNPFNNNATIEVGKDVLTKGNVFFEVYDGLGRFIKKEKITQEFTTLSRDNVPNGLYYYRLYNESTLFSKGIFIVE